MIYTLTGHVRRGVPITWIYNDQLPLEHAFTTLGDTEDDEDMKLWLSLYDPDEDIAKEGPEKGSYKVREDPLRFFTEYIPKVHSFKPVLSQFMTMEEVPHPRGEETM